MKNVTNIYSSNMTFVEKVYLCYGEKAYKKFLKKRFKSFDTIDKGGVATVWDSKNGYYEIAIGVKSEYDIIQLKGLIVHEISHATDYIMKYNDFTDMEFRAYCNQAMYQKAIHVIDKIYSKVKLQ